MNSMSLGLFAKGDEDTAVDMLSDQWATTTNEDVFQQWEPLGVVTGLFSKGGLLDSTPLLNLLHSKFELFGGKLQRIVTAACADVNRGTYHVFNETVADMPRATLSSGSIPGAFPPQAWPEFDVTCIDGGTLWNMNFMSAIQRCREIVDDDSDIIVDMVGPFELTLGKWTNTQNALSNHLWHQSIKKFSSHHD